jgi:hypothetical protein
MWKYCAKELVAERVFILAHYITSKSFASVREAFALSISRLALTSVHRVTKELKLRPYRFQALHHLQ